MMHFNQKLTVKRLIKTLDDKGGYVETWGTIHADVACRINWLRGSEKIFFNKVSYFRDAKVYCHVLDVNSRDRIEYSGEDYEIVNVVNVDQINRFMVLEIKRIE